MISTPSRLYMPELDGLRFIAFFLVFIHHFPFPDEWVAGSVVLGRLHDFGWIGVDVFLVLSAYLLTRLALREIEGTGSFSILRFYVRRAIRIWPLYFLGLGIGLVAYPVAIQIITGEKANIAAMARDHLIPYALFFGNFSYASLRDTLGLFRSLWTVSLEEQFYLFFPLVMLLLPDQRLRNVATFALVGIAVSTVARAYMAWADVSYPWVWVSPITRLDPFVIGVAVAIVEMRFKRLPLNGIVAGVAALAVFIALSSFPQLGASAHTVWQLLLAPLCGVLLLIAARNAKQLSWLGAAPLAALGKVSFGLYVYHRFTIDIFVRVTEAWRIGPENTVLWLALCVATLALTIAIALLSYRYFESYFLQAKRKYEVVPSRPVALMGEEDDAAAGDAAVPRMRDA